MLSMAFISWKVGAKKTEWYDEVKEKNIIWEMAWEGQYFSIKCNGIWVTFQGKKGKHRNPAYRHRILATPSLNLGLELKGR